MTFPAPQKRLGQHFLVDPNIVRKIVSLAAVQPQETVLEIGPGRGVLTKALCPHAGRLIAVELDTRLRETLERELAACPGVELRFGDALEFPYETLPAGTVVVANLPYYLSTPLLFKLFSTRPQLGRMVLMVQAEVADRLLASPGGRQYGILSVLAAYHAEVAVGFSVSAQCFRPRPEVDSTVITLRPRRVPPVAVHDEATLVKTVRAAFAHRRKTIANSLRDERLASAVVAEALTAAHIDAGRRAETLTLEEFAALTNALYEHQGPF